MRPEDPMRARATDSGPFDGWRGARIGAEYRDRERRAMWRVDAEIDVGDPEAPALTILLLFASAVATLVTFGSAGVAPTALELAEAGGSGVSVVATGEWWKLLTANLLHSSVAHFLFNALAIFLVGRVLEHVVGRTLMVAVIVWSAIACSIGAVWIDATNVAVGASGIAFGIMGCAVVIDPRAKSALGMLARPLLIVSSVITFVYPNISIGGHAGGLVGGVLVGLVCWSRRRSDEHPIGRPRRIATAGALALGVAAVAVLVVGPERLPDDGRAVRGPLLTRQVERQLEAQLVRRSTGADLDWECIDVAPPGAFRCRILSDDSGAAHSVSYLKDRPNPVVVGPR